MVVTYGARARENGVIVVSAAGFDSVPVETLLLFLEQKLGGFLINFQ